MQQFAFTPIGIVSSEARERYDAPRQGSLNAGVSAVLSLFPGRNFEQAVADLEGFERIWLLYVFHRNEGWKPRVHVPRGREDKVGVFATRAPYRPNPIGLSCVRLLGVDGLELRLTECDLLDGTPVLDIKPYVPYADAFPGAASGWLEGVDEQRFAVSFSPLAGTQLGMLADLGAVDIEAVLRRHLEYAPTDDRSKRVRPADDAGDWILSWRTWRLRFTCDDELRRVFVHELYSGYTADELAGGSDPYGDKALHLAFTGQFPSETNR